MTTDNDCPICQESLHGNLDVGCTVPCGHVFHQACYETWQTHTKHKKQQKCPCCNVTLTTFIEKIHITLPPAPSSVSTPPVAAINSGSKFRDNRNRRQDLSNQKAKRSALARRPQLRDADSGWDTAKTASLKTYGGASSVKVGPFSTTCLKNDPVHDSNSQKKDQNTWNLKTTSVSASLQRLPSEEEMVAEQRDASCIPSSCKGRGNPKVAKSVYWGYPENDPSESTCPEYIPGKEDEVDQRDTSNLYSSRDDGKPIRKRHNNHTYRYDEAEASYPIIVGRSDFSSVAHLEEEISHVTDMALRKLELSIRPQQHRQYHAQRHGSSNKAKSVE